MSESSNEVSAGGPGPADNAPAGNTPAANSPAAAAGLAIEAVTVQLIVLDASGPLVYDNPDELQLGPPTLFAVGAVSAIGKRYLYLLQQETDPESGFVVLLSILDTSEAPSTRVPPVGCWQRAIVRGTVHLLASDLELTREQIVAFIGGHEPPPTRAQPP